MVAGCATINNMKHDLRSLLKENGLNASRLAAMLGVNKTSTMRWCERGVPVDRLIEVERVTGIPRQKLRPDLFEGMEAAE